jgi:hypothetical protein
MLVKVFAALIVVLAALVGSGGTVASRPRPPGKVLGAVNVIGDSITQLSFTAFSSELRNGYLRYLPTISGRGGTDMAQNLALIEQYEVTNPASYWVIELGTNDALGNNLSWGPDFASEVQALAGQQCVLLVTVGDQLPRGDDVAGGIDVAIFYETLLHANIHEVDWGDAEYGDPSYLLGDHIHPSALGARVLADMIHESLNRACR